MTITIGDIPINDYANQIHENNKKKGFYDMERPFPERMMLVVTELSEAVDAHQKDRFCNVDLKSVVSADDFESNVKNTVEDEIADAIIRLLDISAHMGIDINEHIISKVQFNTTRPRLHGKKY